ncbi:unnamed protein product [Amoebophrya sp. A120]|nr:unnamed protein product [Amoebophrya sp. A120]|eukprot:GSA120T00017234001.1
MRLNPVDFDMFSPAFVPTPMKSKAIAQQQYDKASTSGAGRAENAAPMAAQTPIFGSRGGAVFNDENLFFSAGRPNGDLPVHQEEENLLSLSRLSMSSIKPAASQSFLGGSVGRRDHFAAGAGDDIFGDAGHDAPAAAQGGAKSPSIKLDNNYSFQSDPLAALRLQPQLSGMLQADGVAKSSNLLEQDRDLLDIDDNVLTNRSVAVDEEFFSSLSPVDQGILIEHLQKSGDLLSAAHLENQIITMSAINRSDIDMVITGDDEGRVGEGAQKQRQTGDVPARTGHLHGPVSSSGVEGLAGVDGGVDGAARTTGGHEIDNAADAMQIQRANEPATPAFEATAGDKAGPLDVNIVASPNSASGPEVLDQQVGAGPRASHLQGMMLLDPAKIHARNKASNDSSSSQHDQDMSMQMLRDGSARPDIQMSAFRRGGANLLRGNMMVQQSALRGSAVANADDVSDLLQGVNLSQEIQFNDGLLMHQLQDGGMGNKSKRDSSKIELDDPVFEQGHDSLQFDEPVFAEDAVVDENQKDDSRERASAPRRPLAGNHESKEVTPPGAVAAASDDEERLKLTPLEVSILASRSLSAMEKRAYLSGIRTPRSVARSSAVGRNRRGSISASPDSKGKESSGDFRGFGRGNLDNYQVDDRRRRKILENLERHNQLARNPNDLYGENKHDYQYGAGTTIEAPTTPLPAPNKLDFLLARSASQREMVVGDEFFDLGGVFNSAKRGRVNVESPPMVFTPGGGRSHGIRNKDNVMSYFRPAAARGPDGTPSSILERSESRLRLNPDPFSAMDDDDGDLFRNSSMNSLTPGAVPFDFRPGEMNSQSLPPVNFNSTQASEIDLAEGGDAAGAFSIHGEDQGFAAGVLAGGGDFCDDFEAGAGGNVDEDRLSTGRSSFGLKFNFKDPAAGSGSRSAHGQQRPPQNDGRQQNQLDPRRISRPSPNANEQLLPDSMQRRRDLFHTVKKFEAKDNLFPKASPVTGFPNNLQDESGLASGKLRNKGSTSMDQQQVQPGTGKHRTKKQKRQRKLELQQQRALKNKSALVLSDAQLEAWQTEENRRKITHTLVVRPEMETSLRFGGPSISTAGGPSGVLSSLYSAAHLPGSKVLPTCTSLLKNRPNARQYEKFRTQKHLYYLDHPDLFVSAEQLQDGEEELKHTFARWYTGFQQGKPPLVGNKNTKSMLDLDQLGLVWNKAAGVDVARLQLLKQGEGGVGGREFVNQGDDKWGRSSFGDRNSDFIIDDHNNDYDAPGSAGARARSVQNQDTNRSLVSPSCVVDQGGFDMTVHDDEKRSHSPPKKRIFSEKLFVPSEMGSQPPVVDVEMNSQQQVLSDLLKKGRNHDFDSEQNRGRHLANVTPGAEHQEVVPGVGVDQERNKTSNNASQPDRMLFSARAFRPDAFGHQSGFLDSQRGLCSQPDASYFVSQQDMPVQPESSQHGMILDAQAQRAFLNEGNFSGKDRPPLSPIFSDIGSRSVVGGAAAGGSERSGRSGSPVRGDEVLPRNQQNSAPLFSSAAFEPGSLVPSAEPVSDRKEVERVAGNQAVVHNYSNKMEESQDLQLHFENEPGEHDRGELRGRSPLRRSQPSSLIPQYNQEARAVSSGDGCSPKEGGGRGVVHLVLSGDRRPDQLIAPAHQQHDHVEQTRLSAAGARGPPHRRGSFGQVITSAAQNLIPGTAARRRFNIAADHQPRRASRDMSNDGADFEDLSPNQIADQQNFYIPSPGFLSADKLSQRDDEEQASSGRGGPAREQQQGGTRSLLKGNARQGEVSAAKMISPQQAPGAAEANAQLRQLDHREEDANIDLIRDRRSSQFQRRSFALWRNSPAGRGLHDFNISGPELEEEQLVVDAEIMNNVGSRQEQASAASTSQINMQSNPRKSRASGGGAERTPGGRSIHLQKKTRGGDVENEADAGGHDAPPFDVQHEGAHDDVVPQEHFLDEGTAFDHQEGGGADNYISQVDFMNYPTPGGNHSLPSSSPSLKFNFLPGKPKNPVIHRPQHENKLAKFLGENPPPVLLEKFLTTDTEDADNCGLTRTCDAEFAALAFYELLELRTEGKVEVEQEVAYCDIQILPSPLGSAGGFNL